MGRGCVRHRAHGPHAQAVVLPRRGGERAREVAPPQEPAQSADQQHGEDVWWGRGQLQPRPLVREVGGDVANNTIGESTISGPSSNDLRVCLYRRVSILVRDREVDPGTDKVWH